jgi:hypothetical protein
VEGSTARSVGTTGAESESKGEKDLGRKREGQIEGGGAETEVKSMSRAR